MHLGIERVVDAKISYIIYVAHFYRWNKFIYLDSCAKTLKGILAMDQTFPKEEAFLFPLYEPKKKFQT